MNKNNYTPVINDNEYFEGFVGALGTIVSYFVFRQLFDENKNMGIVLGLTFISTWIIRKIGMNIYKDLKDELDVESSIFNEDGSRKQFGICYQNKSVIPIWVTVILVSIFSYLIILYLITYSHKIF